MTLAIATFEAAGPPAMSGPTHDPKRKLLESHCLLRMLTGGEIDSLLAHARVARYPAGREIFAKGSPGDSMMAIISGRVRISSLSPDGKEIVLNIIDSGEIFGEIAMLDGKERTADATAMTDTELLVLSRRDFLPLLERHADMCLMLLGVACERLRQTSEQVEDVFFQHLEQRLAKALLRLARTGDQPVKDSPRIEIKLSQRELGNLVGATRESINRHLQVWQRSGIVDLEKGSIVVKDAKALAALA